MRKYVARPGIEPRTSDVRVRCPTDSLRGPASWMRKDTLKYKLSEMNFDFEISRINCRRQKYSFSVYSVDYPLTNTRRQLIRKDMTQHGLIAIHSKGR